VHTLHPFIVEHHVARSVCDLIRKSRHRHRSAQRSKAVLRARVTRICTLEATFVTLARLLGRLYTERSERLMVVDGPDIRENAVWGQMTKRKVGDGRDPDRDCNGFPGLAKTCDKLKVLFWDYVAARPAAPGCQALPPPAELILARARSP